MTKRTKKAAKTARHNTSTEYATPPANEGQTDAERERLYRLLYSIGTRTGATRQAIIDSNVIARYEGKLTRAGRKVAGLRSALLAQATANALTAAALAD
jgi:hypothetical protein